MPKPFEALVQSFQRTGGQPVTPPPSPSPVEAQSPAPEEEPPPYDVGLRDAVASGHYNNLTGELYPGFPIEARDIVLDIGCGDGDKAYFCAQRGAALIYTDADGEQVALARRRLTGSRARWLTPIVSDTNPLPLGDAIATKVIASEVMEHVDDPSVFLRELVRVGRPGALYLITVPDPVVENLQKKLAPAAHFEKPNHIRIIGRDEFARIVADSGLEVVYRGSHGFYWALWLLMFWTCKVDLSAASQHPVMQHWSSTWSALLDTEDGMRVKQAFDEFMPVSQYIVARKPGSTAQRGAELDQVGLRDAMASGWYDNATGQLFPGFAIGEGDVVADFGSGDDGAAAGFCARMGAAVTCADLDPAEGTALGSDLHRLQDDLATRVIASEIVERARDRRKALAELARIGRPGAQYLLTVADPAAEGLLDTIPLPGQPETAGRLRGVDELAGLAADAGLAIENRVSYGFFRTIRQLFSRIRDVDPADGARQALVESWSKTWDALLDTPGNDQVRRALDAAMPSVHAVTARKPGGPAAPERIAAHLAAAPISPSSASLSPEESPIDARVLGLHDAVLSGWFNMDRKELFAGFPITPEDVVLDVGCGEGNYAAICGTWGAHVVFTDVDPESVATAAQRLAATPARAITPIVSNADPLPLADGSVSKVLSTEVIEHVDDPVRFLRELARVGKKGALYLLAVPDPVQETVQRQVAPPAFFVRPKPEDGLIRGLHPGHLRTIGRDEFEQLVTDAGLIVESRHYYGFFWALWFAFFWICDVDFAKPAHPLLQRWARTWKLLLDLPEGPRVKAQLDAIMPKSQIIIARKP
jgi:ubiquinone/menaquinone biosynthesis C-methylase UbiE